jgi:hypothetical protein
MTPETLHHLGQAEQDPATGLEGSHPVLRCRGVRISWRGSGA